MAEEDDDVKQYSWRGVLDLTYFDTHLGRGGFGDVYLGKLSNGRMVAVKVRHAHSRQGVAEFVNEVKCLRRVNHANLVRLLGYCEDTKDVLIYEFAVEGSLSDHLHGARDRLPWKQRLNIVVQSALGLEYLHNGCRPTIYHRDIKSENILVMEEMVAKVADFGISKVCSNQDYGGESNDQTHVSTMVKGTFGYLDPEYSHTGQLTAKSDVYSFGVLLLEIITGRKVLKPLDGSSGSNSNTAERVNIVDWAKKKDDTALPDDFFAGNYNKKAMKNVITLARDCTQHCRADRPDMKTVVQRLEKAYKMESLEKKPSWSRKLWAQWYELRWLNDRH